MLSTPINPISNPPHAYRDRPSWSGTSTHHLVGFKSDHNESSSDKIKIKKQKKDNKSVTQCL